MTTTQSTTQDIAEQCGYDWPDGDRRTHRVRTLGWQAVTVSALYHCLGLPRPVVDGRGGRHRVPELHDLTQPLSMFALTTGPVSIWSWA